MSYFEWQSPLHWFGPTLGSSIWLLVCGGVLLVHGHGAAAAAFLVGFAALVMAAVRAWSQRRHQAVSRAWIQWLALFWVVSLAAIATSHVTHAHDAISLDAKGLAWIYVAIGLGGPLLIADTYCRERSDGRRGAFGALFDVLASFF